MLFYRQFRKKLVQKTKKLKQQLIDVIYKAVIQVFTPIKQENKRRIYFGQLVYIQRLCAWLSFLKILCRAIKDFHNYQTNKTIFKLGKNNFIRFAASGSAAGLNGAIIWATISTYFIYVKI